jgi:AraC family transcriptional regulator
MVECEGIRAVLAGAEDPLPSQHFWFEGDGYNIYVADQPRSKWREHSHDCTQISIGLEARVLMEWRTGRKEPERREASGNVVAIIPPGEPHRTLWKRRAMFLHIFLGQRFLSAIASQVLRGRRFDLRAAHLVRDPLIEELGRALNRECETHELSTRFADSVVTVLATHLVRNYNADSVLPGDFRGGLGPARERRVREYIEQSLERDLSIGALAKVAGVSPQYFATLFRRTTGFTPHQYVSQRRVERAQQLLTHADLPLTELAYRCGFTSQSQFNIVFRRFTGITPGKFRAEHSQDRKVVSRTPRRGRPSVPSKPSSSR